MFIYSAEISETKQRVIDKFVKVFGKSLSSDESLKSREEKWQGMSFEMLSLLNDEDVFQVEDLNDAFDILKETRNFEFMKNLCKNWGGSYNSEEESRKQHLYTLFNSRFLLIFAFSILNIETNDTDLRKYYRLMYKHRTSEYIKAVIGFMINLYREKFDASKCLELIDDGGNISDDIEFHKKLKIISLGWKGDIRKYSIMLSVVDVEYDFSVVLSHDFLKAMRESWKTYKSELSFMHYVSFLFSMSSLFNNDSYNMIIGQEIVSLNVDFERGYRMSCEKEKDQIIMNDKRQYEEDLNGLSKSVVCYKLLSLALILSLFIVLYLQNNSTKTQELDKTQNNIVKSSAEDKLLISDQNIDIEVVDCDTSI